MRSAHVLACLFSGLFPMLAWADGPPPYVPPDPVPLKAEANTILANPFPDYPALVPTLVTLNLQKATPAAAFEELAKQTGFSYEPMIRRPKDPAITLKIEKVPYLEALRQIAAQASLHVEPVHAPTPAQLKQHTQPSEPSAPETLWSIAGPFSFSVVTIEHRVQLTKAPSEEFCLAVTADWEPRLHVLNVPKEPKVVEATDDHGNSLLITNVSHPTAYGQDNNFYFRLAYPAKNAGKKIAAFKATGLFTVQTKSETLEYMNPVEGQSVSKEIAGMKVTLDAPAPRGSSTDEFQVRLTVARQNVDSRDWRHLNASLMALRPTVAVADKRALWLYPNDVKSGDDLFQRTFTYTLSTRNAPKPAVTNVAVEVATETKDVTVPIVFKDLPLP